MLFDFIFLDSQNRNSQSTESSVQNKFKPHNKPNQIKNRKKYDTITELEKIRDKMNMLSHIDK